MRKLITDRFVLAMACTLGLIAAGILTYFYGATLSGVQIGLLTLIISKLTSSMSTAYSWFFDGSADKPPVTVGVPDPTKPATLTPKATP